MNIVFNDILFVLRKVKAISQIVISKATSYALYLPKLKNTYDLIREYDKIYGKGNYILINPPQGMGDILACCCVIEYLDVKGKEVLILVSKKYFSDIKAFFPSHYIKMVYTPKRFSDKPCNSYIPLHNKIYLPEKPFVSMKYNMCLAMGIPTNVAFHNQYEKKNSFSDLPVIKEKKTVFISPFATSCLEELNSDFWGALANKLKQKGYEIIFNAPSNSHYSKLYNTCLLNLESTVELVSRCGYFIGWRSGLCDIIGMYANAKMIIVYPSNPHKLPLEIPKGQSYPEAYKNCCSLESLWGTTALEIINNPNILNQIDKEFDYVD